MVIIYQARVWGHSTVKHMASMPVKMKSTLYNKIVCGREVIFHPPGNRKLNPNLETMFMASSEKYTYLSSTIVKEMARYGADLAEFIPREIVDEVNQRMKELEGKEG